jgi:hypothetical protein
VKFLVSSFEWRKSKFGKGVFLVLDVEVGYVYAQNDARHDVLSVKTSNLAAAHPLPRTLNLHPTNQLNGKPLRHYFSKVQFFCKKYRTQGNSDIC